MALDKGAEVQLRVFNPILLAPPAPSKPAWARTGRWGGGGAAAAASQTAATSAADEATATADEASSGEAASGTGVAETEETRTKTAVPAIPRPLLLCTDVALKKSPCRPQVQA